MNKLLSIFCSVRICICREQSRLLPTNTNTINIILLLLLLFTASCKNTPDDLKKFLAFLNTDDTPKVISAVPGTGDFNLPRNQKITVLFNKPMNINSCIQSFSVSPPTRGYFEVTDFSITFTPADNWDYGSYTYVITKSCEDKDGVDIKDLFSATFTIGNVGNAGVIPKVQSMLIAAGNAEGCNTGAADSLDFLNAEISNACMGNPTTNTIVVSFSQAMDPVATQSAISISPDTGFSYQWNSANILHITSDAGLTPETRYTLAINQSAKDINENQLDSAVTGSFFVGTINQIPTVRSIQIATGSIADCNAGNGSQSDLLTTTVSNACAGNPTNNPIQIQFSLGMKPAETLTALKISPSFAASYSWNSDNTLLTITPDDALSYGQRYDMTLDTNAQSSPGVAMESPVLASFTVGNISSVNLLTSINLATGTIADCNVGNGVQADILTTNITNACVGNSTNNPITINFTYPMNTAATRDALTISPPINGSYSWDTAGQVLTLTPDSQLTYGERYTITLATTAKTKADISAETPTTASFVVGDNNQPTLVSTINTNRGSITDCNAGSGTAVDILTTNVSDVCLGNPTTNPIIINFAYPMDTAITQTALSISPAITAKYAWSSGDQVLTITPDTYLEYNQRYEINISTTARSKSGITTTNPTISSFIAGGTTDLTFVSSIQVLRENIANCNSGSGTQVDIMTSTVNDACVGNPTTNSIVVNFTYPMETVSSKNAISISPAINASYAWSGGDTVLTITSDSYLSFGQNYTITLATTAQTKTLMTAKNATIASFTAGGTTEPAFINTINIAAGSIADCNAASGTTTDIITNNVNNACVGNSTNTPIVISFAYPMDTTSTRTALNISPTINANYAWSGGDTVLTITPDSYLTYGQRYTITLSTGAKTKTEISRSNITTATFIAGGTTEPNFVDTIQVSAGSIADCAAGSGTATDIIATTVNNGCVGNDSNNPIVVNFTYPMDTASSQAAISISPNINATYVWSAGDTVLTITPDSFLNYGLRYTVTLGTSAKTKTEITRNNTTSASFIAGGIADANLLTTIKTYNGTLSACNSSSATLSDIITTSINNACMGHAQSNVLEFTFNSVMQTEVTENAISISPSIDGNFVWSGGNQVLTFTSDSLLTYGQRYTVTIQATAKSTQEISQGNSLSYSFVVGAITFNPEIQAVGLASQGCATTSPGTGNAAGGNWTLGSCFWDNSLAMLTPTSYKFRGGDDGSGSNGSTNACGDVNTDNFRLIFNTYMDVSSTTAAISLKRLSPPISTILLATYEWKDCQSTYPYGCRVVDLVFAEQEASCNGTTFGTATTGGDFNLQRTDNAPANYPIYQISVDTSARDVNSTKLENTFYFSMEGK